jgi:hypothetical protein
MLRWCSLHKTAVTVLTAISFVTLSSITTALAQTTAKTTGAGGQFSAWAAPDGRIRFVRAVVVDERLSALRREPSSKSVVMQRLRSGRQVYIVGMKKATATDPAMLRIAVTRRTRGWIHHSAIAVPGHSGEDQRVIDLITGTKDGLERITLCKLFIDRFPRSPLTPRVLLIAGKEADKAATALGRRAQKRLKDATGPITSRELYLNDPGLDRYSRLLVNFNFNEETGRYAYDGHAYREILKRFPASDEATRARATLERASGLQARASR